MSNQKRAITGTIQLLALIAFLVPAGIYSLWLYTIRQTTEFMEAVALFKSYFPEFLQGRYNTIYFSILFGFLSLTLNVISLTRLQSAWKWFHLVLIFITILLLALNVFGLM